MSYKKPTEHQIIAYVENYILYGDQSRAFRAAFPDNNASPEAINVRASEFHKLSKVCVRIDEFREQLREREESNALFALEEKRRSLKALYLRCMKEKKDAQGNDVPVNPSAAIRAIAEDNRMMGVYDVKSEVGHIPSVIIVPEELTKEEALRQYAEAANAPLKHSN